MGDSESTRIQPSFNGSLDIKGRPEALTAHGGVVLLRELDSRLGITAGLADSLVDQRAPSRVRHPLSQMLRTVTYGMAIDSLGAASSAAMGADAAFRMAISDKRGHSMLDDDCAVASQPTLSRFFAQLGTNENLPMLRHSLLDSASRAVHANHGGKLEHVTLDIDSYPIKVHGHQAGSEHNGYYRTRCYHPLGVMLGETGHWLDLKLRPGNVHTSAGAEEMLCPLVDRARESLAESVSVRGDAGFVGPELLSALDAKSVPYALRLPTNKDLKAHEEIHARRSPGRPPEYEQIICHEIDYRAQTWKEPRRVILVVIDEPGELYLRTFFIVTSFTKEELDDRDVLDFYRARGTMEGHIGEMKAVIYGHLSSTNRKKESYGGSEVQNEEEPIDPERVNAAALCIHALSYNLLNTLRLLGGASGFVDEPAEVSLRRARRLLLVPGRIIVSARKATLVVTDAALDSWRRTWERMRALHAPPTAA